MNNYIQKATDFYLKCLRSGDKISSLKMKGNYWVTNGYVVHKIPEELMEINPNILQTFKIDYEELVKEAENGFELKETKLTKKTGNRTAIPFISDDKSHVVWFNKSCLELFPRYSTLYTSGKLNPAAVKVNGQVIGIVLPMRIEEDITLFI